MASSIDTNSTGSGQLIDIRQSFGTSNYVIAVDGTFPSRSLSSYPLLGSVAMFAGNFAPRGWEFWIDRGGTFTDIVARRPDGTLVLDAGAALHIPKGMWHRISSAAGTLAFSVRVADATAFAACK